MKRFAALSLAVVTASFAVLPDSLDLNGQINLQGQKFFGPSDNATQETSNNLDQWYGEAVVGTHYKEGKVESEVELSMYPQGFGVRPREVTYFQDSVSNKTAVQDANEDQVVLSKAWFAYGLPFGGVGFKVGRFSTNLAQGTGMYGNYVDQDPDGGFKSRGATHNALELSILSGKFFTSLMAQSTDNQLNTGRVRFQTSYYAPRWTLDVAYRVNALDKFRGANDSKIQQRFHLGGSVLIVPAFKAYYEGGIILQETDDKDYDQINAMLVGVTIPTAKLLDNLALECEISPDRTTPGEKAGTEVESPVLFNLQATKALSTNTLLDIALFSDPMGADYFDLGVAARLQANLW